MQEFYSTEHQYVDALRMLVEVHGGCLFFVVNVTLRVYL